MKTAPPESTESFLILLSITILITSAVIIGIIYTGGNQGFQTAAATGTTKNIELPDGSPPPILVPTQDGPANSSTKLAWFTSLPKNRHDILTVANWFDLFILIQGDEANREMVRQFDMGGPILQYLDFESIQDPGSCFAEPKLNQVAFLVNDFCSISENHPDWFLLNDKGERITQMDNGNLWYLMDPGNIEWQGFFLDRIKTFQADPNWDGVFFDNVPLSLAFLEDGNNVPTKYSTDEKYQSAVQSFLEFLHKEYFQTNNKLMFANLVSRRGDINWVDQLNFIDGAMLEGWAIDWPDGYRSPDEWEEHMKIAELTQQQGKVIILVSLGNQSDFDLQRFAFASYLLINDGKAVFRFANSDKYREIWIYDNYSFDLGEPLNYRYLTNTGWKRDFKNGSVVVDPESHHVEIIVK